MKQLLVKIVTNSAVRKAALALLLAILAAAGLNVGGCAHPVVPRLAEQLDCQTALLKGVLPKAELAEQALRAGHQGDYLTLADVLLNSGLSVDDANKVITDFQACAEKL